MFYKEPYLFVSNDASDVISYFSSWNINLQQ